MSVTILNEIDKAKSLVEGLRKNMAEAKMLGADEHALSSLEEACADLKRKDDELDALRRQATLKVRENNELLAALKERSMAWRRAVKQRYPQQEWARFGVGDKR